MCVPTNSASGACFTKKQQRISKSISVRALMKSVIPDSMIGLAYELLNPSKPQKSSENVRVSFLRGDFFSFPDIIHAERELAKISVTSRCHEPPLQVVLLARFQDLTGSPLKPDRSRVYGPQQQARWARARFAQSQSEQP